jgi:hypothetical protein
MRIISTIFLSSLILTGCSSAPSLGYFETSLTWACTITDEVNSYQVQVLDAAGERVAVSNDVVVNELSGGYVDGLCKVSTEFDDIPMVGGPFTAAYFADGEDTGRSVDFDVEDLTPIPAS